MDRLGQPRTRVNRRSRVRLGALDAAGRAAHEPGMLIYKIFRAAEYQAFTRSGRSAGAPVDLADGYVHLSTGPQVAETLSRHFSGETGLHLLALDSEGLADLRWEPSRGGHLFPHLYRDLARADILWSREIPLGPNGHMTGDLA